MSDQAPLTHHEILSFIEPFTRAGWRVDLAASDRAQRELAFSAIEHPAVAPLPPLRESLRLDLGRPGRPRLVRELAAADGQRATLQADDADLGELLARVQAVPAARQWVATEGTLLAFDHSLAGSDLLVRGARMRLAGLTLKLSVTPVRGFPAEIELKADEGLGLALPRDLLAVLGRAWGELNFARGAWQGSIALRGDGLRRSRDAEERLLRTLRHLRQTLAEPPARFRQRHRAVRWVITLREMLPMSLLVALVAGAWLLREQGQEKASALALLVNVAPPLMMGLFFMRREMPRIGLPRPPRGPADSAWPATEP